jgi:putative nucleotidyltransferase with HDIG domain
MELGSWSHLIGRFFKVLAAGPLTDEECRDVESWLDREEEADIYRQQSVADQRHGLEAARRVAAVRGDRRDLVRAALLHDVGKRWSNLGVIERSLASLFTKLRLPVRGSWRRYLDHGPLGAEELSRVGSETLVVDFARHHHGLRPMTIPPDEWDLLKSVD